MKRPHPFKQITDVINAAHRVVRMKKQCIPGLFGAIDLLEKKVNAFRKDFDRVMGTKKGQI